MRHIALIVTLGFLMVLANGCTLQTSEEKAIDSIIDKNQNVNSTPSDKRSCEAIGGKWGFIGLSDIEECNLPASDAEKECSDSMDCEGACIAKLSKEEFNKVEKNEIINTKGKCSEWKRIDGCHPFVINGKVDRIFCID